MHISTVLLFACCTLVGASNTNEDILVQSVTTFAYDHGFTKVELVLISSNLEWMRISFKLLRQLMRANVPVSMLHIEDIEEENDIQKGNYIFVPSVNELQNWNKILHVIAGIQVKRSLLMTSILPEYIPSLNLNCQLYLFHVSTNSWFDVVTLVNTGAPIIQRLALLSLNSLNSFSKPAYNFQNITISSVDLNWEPYVNLTGCDTLGRACHMNGFAADVASIAEQLLNLNIEFTMEQTGVFGSLPIIRDDNSSEWIRIAGEVLNKNSHISLILWYMLPNRLNSFDMAWISHNALVGVVSPKPLELDWLLFLRPFTDKVWIISLGLIILLAAFSELSLICHHGNTKASSFRIAKLSGFLFFVMTNAFYSGAMTMFFSNDIQIPFKNTKEAINAYPEWKLLMISGTEILYEPHVAYSVEHRTFWERIQNRPKETIVESYEEGLRKVLNEQALIELDDGVFRHQKSSDEFIDTNLQVAFKSRIGAHVGILLPDNSPLTSAMVHVFMQMNEHGIVARLKHNWETGGTPIQMQKVNSSNQMTLSLGQLVLAYAVMTLGLLLSLMALVGEVVLKKQSRRLGQK